jgi:hypothetical protein
MAALIGNGLLFGKLGIQQAGLLHQHFKIAGEAVLVACPTQNKRLFRGRNFASAHLFSSLEAAYRNDHREDGPVDKELTHEGCLEVRLMHTFCNRS